MAGTEDVRVVEPPTAIVRGGRGERGTGKDLARQTGVAMPAIRERGRSVKVLREWREVVPAFRGEGGVLHAVAGGAVVANRSHEPGVGRVRKQILQQVAVFICDHVLDLRPSRVGGGFVVQVVAVCIAVSFFMMTVPS